MAMVNSLTQWRSFGAAESFEHFDDSGGVVVWISVIFRFGQDEQTLFVE
jgi:hypothetical protein